MCVWLEAVRCFLAPIFLFEQTRRLLRDSMCDEKDTFFTGGDNFGTDVRPTGR